MGKILQEYLDNINSFKEVVPDELYSLILDSINTEYERLEPNIIDKEKYFIEGYDELSQSIYDLLKSGIGYYIMGYVNDYNINRLSAGFKTIEELVHYSKWVIDKYYDSRKDKLAFWNELKEKDIDKTDKEIIEKTLKNAIIENDLKYITYNIENEEDFIKRLEIIKILEDNKCLAYELLTSIDHYKIIDKIHSSLLHIENIEELNKAPVGLNQSEHELRRVT